MPHQPRSPPFPLGSPGRAGTLAPRGALHDFLSAVNPAYVGSAAVQRVLAAMPGVAHWVVERSNVASLPSAAQLEQLLELHAALAAPSSTAAAELAGRVCGGSDAPAAAGREVEAQLASTAVAPPGAGAEAGTGVAAAPAPAGPEEAGAGGSSLQPAACSTGLEAAGSDMAKLICRFVDDAADGKGRWNWVEEDDYILLQVTTVQEGWWGECGWWVQTGREGCVRGPFWRAWLFEPQAVWMGCPWPAHAFGWLCICHIPAPATAWRQSTNLALSAFTCRRSCRCRRWRWRRCDGPLCATVWVGKAG